MASLVSTNPSDNSKLGEVEVSTSDDVKKVVQNARAAEKMWREIGIDGRTRLMRKLIDKLGSKRAEIEQLQAKEMGMPITQAKEDTDFAIEYLKSYCDGVAEALRDEITVDEADESHKVVREPYGVAAVIVPWNFPLSNWVWQCGQNLLAGNCIVFKHSEETALCCKWIEGLINSVLPDGVFNVVYGDGKVGAELIEQDVDLICFTGSSATGARVNESAAKRFIPTVLEMGGSAPGMVFDDAQVDEVLEYLYTVRFMNAGQVCDGLKRLIVHESKLNEVTEKLTKLLKTKRLGNATDAQTDIGPLVAGRQAVLLTEQVKDATERGATATVCSEIPVSEGAYYPPTLLTDVTSDMRVWNEEVFGPVLPIVKFKDEAEAVELANDTQYGLGAYVFTSDKERFNRVAVQIKSGMVSQNSLSYVHPNNFFGGYKASGNGREHAKYGFDEVTQTKVIAGEK